MFMFLSFFMMKNSVREMNLCKKLSDSATHCYATCSPVFMVPPARDVVETKLLVCGGSGSELFPTRPALLNLVHRRYH